MSHPTNRERMVGKLRIWPCCGYCCDLPPHGKGGRRIKRRYKRRERQGWKSEVKNMAGFV